LVSTCQKSFSSRRDLSWDCSQQQQQQQDTDQQSSPSASGRRDPAHTRVLSGPWSQACRHTGDIRDDCHAYICFDTGASACTCT
jgi:hypothetical protein